MRLQVVTRIEDLLPADSPAAEDYRAYAEIFGGASNVYVVVTPAADDTTSADLVAAAEEVASALEALDRFDWVRAGVTDEDEDFFFDELLPRAPLLTDLDDAALERKLSPDALRGRARLIREKLLMPLAPFEEQLLTGDPFGLLERMPAQGANAVDPATGGFVSASGDGALVVAASESRDFDADAGRELAKELKTLFAEVGARQERPVDLVAVGGPLYAAADQRLIRRDLARTLSVSAFCVLTLLFLYFRGLTLPGTIFVSTAAGILWTAGLAGVLTKSLSIIALSFVSILVGLGVDHGIHAASAFVRQRAAGRPPIDGVIASLRRCGAPVITASLTTAGAFLVLVGARFLPVREIGFLSGSGILLVLLASIMLGAALVALLPATRTPKNLPRLHRLLQGIVDRCTRLASEHPLRVLLSGGAILVVAGIGLSRVDFSYDLRSLRPADHPSIEAEKTFSRLFGAGLNTTQIVLEAGNRSEALDRAADLAERLRSELPGDTRIVTPSDWLVEGRRLEARLQRITPRIAAGAVKELRSALDEAGLREEPFEASLRLMQDIGTGMPPPAIPQERLPAWMHGLLRETQDRAFVMVEILLPVDRWLAGPPAEVMASIREQAPEARIASVPRIGNELRHRAGGDFSRLGAWSLVVIFAIVVVSAGARPTRALRALLPAVLGFIVAVGAFGLLNLRLDPVSAAMAPLILGIGLDDGLHAVHGEALAGSLRDSLRFSGPAMSLTTLTTCAGFGGLIFSRIPALRSAGALVAIGTVVCLAATLLILPAIAALGRRHATTP